MGRFKEPYSLYPRKMASGKVIWYYRTYDDDGRRTNGISTEQISKTKARQFCDRLSREGRLVPTGKPAPKAEGRAPQLEAWALARKWWKWTDAGPECSYCIGELARSADGSPAIQRDHADRSARILRDNILPLHGSFRMDAITTEMCEDLMTLWKDSGASPKTINNRASVYRVMMAEAERLGVILRSPWSKVKTYRSGPGGKGILSIEEFRTLMSPKALEVAWKGHLVYYAANLLSSVTGLRQGEVLALKDEDIKPDHVRVAGSWGIKYGEGPQKTKRGVDEIPIPKFVYNQIKPLLAWGGYVFSFTNGVRPCTGNRVNDALIFALDAIGIDDTTRRARKLTFHSWRAFANTYFRNAGVPDAKVRQITRHVSEAMTEHYSAFRLDDFREVAEAQGALVKELTKRA